MEESYLLKEQQIISSKIQRIFAQEGQEKQGQRSFLAKKYGNNNQKVFDLMLEVKGYVSQSFGVHPATPSQKKGSYRKGKEVSRVLGKNLHQQFLTFDEKSASNTFSTITHKFGLRMSNNKNVFSEPLKTGQN